MLCHLRYPCHLSLPENSENSLLFFILLFHALLYEALVLAENPSLTYLHKYFHISNYFIYQDTAILWLQWQWERKSAY